MGVDKHSRVWACACSSPISAIACARPLEARPDRTATLIWFVTDVHGGKDDEIRRLMTSGGPGPMTRTYECCASNR
jgi:hypothetical protein